MKNLALNKCMLLLGWLVFSTACDDNKETEYPVAESNGIPVSIEYSENSETPIPESAEDFFQNTLTMQPLDEFRMILQRTSNEVYVQETFNQYYDGIEVVGGGVTFHYKNGIMYFVHGIYIPIEYINTKPSITESEAAKSFALYKKISLETVYDTLAELLIKEVQIKADMLPLLVFRVRLFADYTDNAEYGYVDAHMGNVVATEPALIFFDKP